MEINIFEDLFACWYNRILRNQRLVKRKRFEIAIHRVVHSWLRDEHKYIKHPIILRFLVKIRSFYSRSVTFHFQAGSSLPQQKNNNNNTLKTLPAWIGWIYSGINPSLNIVIFKNRIWIEYDLGKITRICPKDLLKGGSQMETELQYRSNRLYLLGLISFQYILYD